MVESRITAVGHFIANYSKNLEYILNFQSFKSGLISLNEYDKKEKGYFYNFLIDYKVIRGVTSDRKKDMLRFTKEWVLSKNSNDVDKFAKKLDLKGFTNGGLQISLASKILMLNNPWHIFPYDKQAKNAVSYYNKTYKDYHELVLSKKQSILKQYAKMMGVILPLITEIERKYKTEIPKIATIRNNRFVDNHLWMAGKAETKHSKN